MGVLRAHISGGASELLQNWYVCLFAYFTITMKQLCKVSAVVFSSLIRTDIPLQKLKDVWGGGGGGGANIR